MKIIIYPLCIFLFCIGCRQVEKNEIPQEIEQLGNLKIINGKAVSNIKFTLEHSFGESDEVLIGAITGLAVSDEGEVLIADNPQKTIHIFNKKGIYQGNLGGAGFGPGEFQLITDMKVRDNILQVLDRVQYRMNVFNVENSSILETKNAVQYPKNVKEHEEISKWIPNVTYPLYGQHILTGFMQHPWDSRIKMDSYNLDKKRMVKYYLMDYEGNIISDEVFEQRDNEDLVANVDGDHLFHIPSPPVPFLGKTIVAISKENMIYTAWTNDFLIKVFSPDGSYSKAYYMPHFSKRKISRNELAHLFDENDRRSQQLVQHAELPEFWPSIFAITIDDKERLWIAVISNKENMLEWWVLDKRGKLLAKADLPGDTHLSRLMRKPLLVIKGGYLYQHEVDVRNGIGHIAKYRIEFSEQ